VLCIQASDVLHGRSHRTIVLGVWPVPEPSSPKGKYITEDGSALRALGVVCLHRDIEGLCRICGSRLTARRHRHHGPVKTHTRRVRDCDDCNPDSGTVDRLRDALQAVFDDLEVALCPPARKAQVTERIELSKSDFERNENGNTAARALVGQEARSLACSATLGGRVR
jgi:hypothetical protein